MQIPTAQISWMPSFRIISDRFPSVNFFERIADPADWEALFEIESLTDPSASNSVGNLSVVPIEDRITGPGVGRVMPSFTFLNQTPPGSRFSNSQFGAYYASNDLDTAIAETVHNRQNFMRNHNITTAQELDQLVILADIAGLFHDIRNLRAELSEVYDPDDYAASQTLASRLRSDNSNGIVYLSVRQTAGECIAAFRPPVISNAKEEKHLTYIWDGTRITAHFEKQNFQEVPDLTD
ncbi:MAG: RES family NAD+ phosphorylase [Candidatus Melainabacteria bacterium]|nr:RES family NAD+ phosphorylase [Candidatus Melainabacteria bacterium]